MSDKESFEHNGCKIFCGDYRETITYENYFDLILTSPPYNIGSKSPKRVGKRKLGGYDAKSWGSIEEYQDSLPEAEYQEQQHEFLLWCSKAIKENGVIIYNHKVRHKDGMLMKPDKWFPSEDILVLHDEIVWDRGSTHNHCKYFTYPQSERLYVFKKPGGNIHFKNQPFYWNENTKGLGDVWRIERDRGNGHNAPFPIKLARQCIRMWSPPNGIVCDPYSGSGTTMIASYIEDRKFIGSEILNKYFVMGVDRFLGYVEVSEE